MSEREADVLVTLQDALLGGSGDTPDPASTVQAGARGLSHFGEHALGWFALAGAGAAVNLKRPEQRDRWLELGASAFTSHAASVVLKRVVRRKRPSDPRIRVGVGTPSRLSFPSSHSTSTAAALVSLCRITGSPLPLAGIPVMMLSRLVLGVHYPTDVLAGVALGIATERAVHSTVRTVKENNR
ncbi:MAG: phosphatase PAP2 family protein [Mycobacteriaceae bacterium]|uniref:phosphatase PAP2 family protein n=1 Tax=Corynebacterium sp. TaxID=1720 RepID=UPI003F98D198